MLRRRFELQSSVCCERGDLRKSNQDCTLALSGELAGRSVGLYVVADGCGGMAHGEKISRLLVDSFAAIWQNALPRLLGAARLDESQIYATLQSWLGQINAVAYQFGQETQSQVGSTLTLLLVMDNAYYILNVGDSRVYLYRRGILWQLSEDQSLLADMLRNQEIRPEEVSRFQRRNVLTMCVGYFEQVQSFYKSGKIKHKDIFLLCSDGLHGVVDVNQLTRALPERIEKNSAKRLRELIPEGRAHDNISVLLVQAL